MAEPVLAPYPVGLMRGLQIALIVLTASVGSCGPAASKGGFNSANPAAKMYAIEQAAASGDQSAVPRIVEQLDSDDPAVRALAIASLERLTGQTHGYRDYDPPEMRREAIERWRQAIGQESLEHSDSELARR